MNARRTLFSDPLFWLAVCGGAMAVFCRMDTSFDFLMKALGVIALLAAWSLFLLRKNRKKDLSDRQKRLWRTAKVITFTVVAICLVTLLTAEGLILSGARGTPESDAHTVIVLGAGIRGDQPSATLRSRLDAACEYLAEHPDAAVILSGGRGDDERRTEASVMQAYLLRRGVEPGRLYLEDVSRNTEENLRFSRQIMLENGLEEPVLVVSNSYHLFRAAHLARREGLSAGTLAAPVPYGWLVPPCYLREAGSLILMYLREIF